MGLSSVVRTITAAGLDATLDRLSAQGIEPEKPPPGARGGLAHLLRVRSDGYRIELIESE